MKGAKMRVIIRNKSNKRRSKTSMSELKEFACDIANKLKISNKIKVIRITYTKTFHGYYPKGKPMFGFKKLLNSGVVTIDLAHHWDYSKESNREGIIHELTHVKQLVEKRLVIDKDCKQVIWNGKTNNTWNKFRFSNLDGMNAEDQVVYIEKFFPWERDVNRNIARYNY